MDSQNDNRKVMKLYNSQIHARNEPTISMIFPQTCLKKVRYEAVLVSVSIQGAKYFGYKFAYSFMNLKFPP